MTATATQAPPPLPSRPVPNVICLFDVDGTLTPARQTISPEMHATLQKLREKVVVGFVGGSDFPKQVEQLCPDFVVKEAVAKNSSVTGSDLDAVLLSVFDYCFSENGLTAYREGQSLGSESFISSLGDDRYNKLIRFVLGELAKIEEIKVRRGTFVELRRGMVNISPIGRSASIQERIDYEKLDIEHGIRKRLVQKLKDEFPDYGLTYSIGGQISFDVFPNGWDKTYCLRHIPEGTTVHFFGDKTAVGGNDYELYTDSRTVGHSVKNPEETIKIINELFFSEK